MMDDKSLKHDRRTKVSDKHKAQRAAMGRAARPFLASTVVIIRDGKSGPEILMGQRSSRHDFMPDVYVFPGGRVDRADSYAPYVGALAPRTENLLESALPAARARACALAAIRETFEETGLILGRKGNTKRNINHPGWDRFFAKDFLPDISKLAVFARAETPPYRPKRFDTWFFLARVGDGKELPPVSDSVELLNTGWFPLKEAKALKMHVITENMVNEVEKLLGADALPSKIPFSRYRHGRFIYTPFGA